MLLTGTRGIGKTTVLIKTVDALKAGGFRVGGMIQREAREDNMRVGFEILDLTNDKHGWLAHVDQNVGPQVGKYHVNLQDLENIGAKAIEEATEKSIIVVVDEIGPMELFSQKFKQAVKQALESQKLVLAVVHAKAKDQLISEAKQRDDSKLFFVTLLNRGSLPVELYNQAFAVLYLSASDMNNCDKSLFVLALFC